MLKIKPTTTKNIKAICLAFFLIQYICIITRKKICHYNRNPFDFLSAVATSVSPQAGLWDMKHKLLPIFSSSSKFNKWENGMREERKFRIKEMSTEAKLVKIRTNRESVFYTFQAIQLT
jgi:hypothetical protein